MVDIALLGCGGGMPMPNRFLSSFLINYRGRKILIDCGEGTQVSMRMLGWGFKSIDIICITHGHGDHIVGLPGLLATIGNSGRIEPMTIIGPEGITNIINGLRVIVPYLPYDINIVEHPKKPLSIGVGLDNMKVLSKDSGDSRQILDSNSQTLRYKALCNEDIVISTLKVDHSSSCIGYSFYIRRKPKFDVDMATTNEVPKVLWNRLQKGEDIIYDGKTYEPGMVLGSERRGIKLSYITDTRPVDAIPDFINGSDLFICEGTYGSDNDLEKAIKNKHMTFREAAELAYKGNVQELLLTHFSPALTEPELYKDNSLGIFPNTMIGYDRLIKTLAFKD
ncbi:ribonuclease Z [Clostridium polyendosporum]|uniref:Ribonuclease Z n=1 Tax=Clostridium polyendosporum TaxID=69208 RepID=A0A919VFK6_9CLOT|nr:ribonuclease Z [Clostridium polyendosporum]GIM28247.1 ribonuclease Z [Clostridium polyendosporum]